MVVMVMMMMMMTRVTPLLYHFPAGIYCVIIEMVVMVMMMMQYEFV